MVLKSEKQNDKAKTAMKTYMRDRRGTLVMSLVKTVRFPPAETIT